MSLEAGLHQPPQEATKAPDGRARCGVPCGGRHEQQDVRKLCHSSSSVTQGVIVRVNQLLTALGEFHSGEMSEQHEGLAANHALCCKLNGFLISK